MEEKTEKKKYKKGKPSPKGSEPRTSGESAPAESRPPGSGASIPHGAPVYGPPPSPWKGKAREKGAEKSAVAQQPVPTAPERPPVEQVGASTPHGAPGYGPPPSPWKGKAMEKGAEKSAVAQQPVRTPPERPPVEQATELQDTAKKGNRKDKRKGKPSGDVPRPSTEPSSVPEVREKVGLAQRPSSEPQPKPAEKSKGSPREEVGDLKLRHDILSLVPARSCIRKENKEGDIIKVKVNCFPIKLRKPDIKAYQYDVVIDPDVPKYMLRRAWNEFVKRNFPGKYPSYDGKKIAVSSEPLMKEQRMSDTFEVFNPENEKMKSYTVTLTLTNVLELKKLFDYLNVRQENVSAPMSELAVLDIVLRNQAANSLVSAGRSFFAPGERILPLGNGMEMWYGFYQSAIFGWKLYLNFDVAHKGFPSAKNVVEIMEEVCFPARGVSGDHGQINPAAVKLDYQNNDALTKFLKNLKVEYKIPGKEDSKRVYKVNGVRPESADKEFFTLDDKKKTSVVDYYKNQKEYKIKYPNLPCLWVGSSNNQIYVPMELCTVVKGQKKNTKLNEQQTAQMIKYAAKPPDARAYEIKNNFRRAAFENPFTNAFGVSVAGEFEEVSARVLKPPVLEADKQIFVRNGQWMSNKFNNPMPMKDWCVLCLDRFARQQDLDQFERLIMNTAKNMGMNARPPLQKPIMSRADRRDLIPIFNDFLKREVNLVFVVVPDRGNVYALVKQISEIEVGILTQCVRCTTLRKAVGDRGASTLSNILLKVNTKLNGINHSLAVGSRPRCLSRPAMIVGADVTHPSPDAVNIPSIAAVAASHDPKAFKYNTIRKLQPPKMEIIQDFEGIIREQLLYFYRQTNFKPEKIIVFRDGVSEGQIQFVLQEELLAIRRACISLQKENYEPKITYLIVQKRHHTRFFPPEDCKYTDSRNKNVPAGTCVDTEVVHPRDVDFYLVSHASPLGTARPTKYKLVYDDNDMSENEIETLAYYLCHLISRCNKSISYPAPTYYAHLAAFRARAHLTGIDVNINSAEEKKKAEKKIAVKEYFSTVPMFFV